MSDDRDIKGVPWSAAEIGFAVFVSLACQTLLYLLLISVGWFNWYYGSDALVNAAKLRTPEGAVAQARLGLWVVCLAFVPQMALTLGLMRRLSLATWSDLGFEFRNANRSAVYGAVLALVLTPLAYGVQFVVQWVLASLGAVEEVHAFTQVAKSGLHVEEWILLVIAAVIVAPVWEETLYRGIVQPWILTRSPWSGAMAFAVALLLTLMLRGEQLREGMNEGGRQLLLQLLPVLVLVVLAGVWLVLAMQETPWAGLFAAAVLFAWVHVRVWPSPVPLVVLALGLGWLRWRTETLVGSVVLHAIFNAIACGLLFV